MRVGIGFDAHRFVRGRPLLIGGVKIPHSSGLHGHSDADVLLHAICDAMLGALALGDIGVHFPDSSPRFKGIASTELLERVVGLVEKEGCCVGNIDATVVAESPRLADHIDGMRTCIAGVLRCKEDLISIKATTTEGMGFCGRDEGIAAMAVVALKTVTRDP